MIKRPVKPMKKDRLSHTISVRFSEAQRAEIQEAVVNQGFLNEADAIRSFVHQAMHLPDIIRTIVRDELKKAQE